MACEPTEVLFPTEFLFLGGKKSVLMLCTHFSVELYLIFLLFFLKYILKTTSLLVIGFTNVFSQFATYLTFLFFSVFYHSLDVF